MAKKRTAPKKTAAKKVAAKKVGTKRKALAKRAASRTAKPPGKKPVARKPRAAKAKKRAPQSKLPQQLAQAMRDAALGRDARGLVPLGRARSIVEAATTFDRGATVEVGGQMVTDADRLWAALLSLADGPELVAAARRIEWRYHPRGRDNTAPFERYGASILPWIASCVDEAGVLVNFPWCVGPCLLAMGTREAFDLVWSLEGYNDSSEMAQWQVSPPRILDRDTLAAAADDLRAAWIGAHPEVALPLLAGRAAAGDERAAAWMRRRAVLAPRAFRKQLASALGSKRATALADKLQLAQSLTTEAILAHLDGAASQGKWPLFNYAADGRIEYFALRLIAVRAKTGDGWGIAIERVSGSYPDALSVQRCLYGSNVGEDAVFGESSFVDFDIECEGHVFHDGVLRGPAGQVTVDEGFLEERDVRPGRCCEIGYYPIRVAAIHAYLAAFPGGLWPAPEDAIAMLGFGRSEPATLLLVSDAFHHVIGPNGREGVPEQPWEVLPSASETYRSLADALVARDASRFVPGESNLDWRLHAYLEEYVAPPWTLRRADVSKGWLPAAMAEAAVATDARGLMPLEEARALVRGATRFERGTGRRVGGHWAQGSDRLWAALLSLEDGDELAREGGRLEWTLPVRGGAENTAAAQRYGSGAVPWLRALARDGVLQDVPGCLRATLLAIPDEAALDLLLELRGFSTPGADGSAEMQLDALLDTWLDRHPSSLSALVQRAARNDARAAAVLRVRALLDTPSVRRAAEATGVDAGQLFAEIGVPSQLSTDHILIRLDRAAATAATDQSKWPRFCHGLYPKVAEYHGMRVLAARARRGDGWGVLIERLTGYGHDTRVMRYGFGSTLPGGHLESVSGKLDVELDYDTPAPADLAQLTERPDYWAAREARSMIAPLRAWFAANAGRCWSNDEAALAALGLSDADVLIRSTSFSHADGKEPPEGAERRPWHVPPSASRAYRSLSEAIVRRDGTAFDPGEPNTDWKTHAQFSAEED